MNKEVIKMHKLEKLILDNKEEIEAGITDTTFTFRGQIFHLFATSNGWFLCIRREPNNLTKLTDISDEIYTYILNQRRRREKLNAEQLAEEVYQKLQGYDPDSLYIEGQY